MNKKEFVKEIHKELTTDSLKQASEVLDVVGKIISDTLKKADSVTLPGIGKFGVRVKIAHTARNPQTGGSVEVPARIVPTFKAVKALKNIINEKVKK